MESVPHRPEGVLKHMGVAFGLALLVYIGLYGCDRHLRVHKGPWEVGFLNTNGVPMLSIRQADLGISNVVLILAKEEVQPHTRSVQFDGVRKTIPFGRIKFEDLTYLPGS